MKTLYFLLSDLSLPFHLTTVTYFITKPDSKQILEQVWFIILSTQALNKLLKIVELYCILFNLYLFCSLYIYIYVDRAT